MNFKRLELYGFKSFADRTVIEFNDGLTGIVGPNGSGKSNFSDAIKWVLGETSAKQLRGKSMQDVIFVGTQRRSQMSYCEVTLVFDNTNQKIFKNLAFDEVSFTRKLYRSGESEYLLNGTNILFKNLRDIIRDTGLGKDGYSIIGQGRVAEIINSKPENRRAIFEEAAGISKYKKRKDDAEDRLEKTRDHLERLQDILQEIERQLTPLKKKAENAKKYQELYESQKQLDVNHFIYAYENNDIEIEKIQTLIKGISEEIELLNSKIKENDDLYLLNSKTIDKIDADLDEYKDLRTRILVANQKKLGEGETLQERLSYGKKEEQNLIADIEKYNQKIVDCEELIAKLLEKQNEIQKDYDILKSEIDTKESELLRLTDEITSRNAEFEKSELERYAAIEKLGDVNIDYTKLQADYDYLSKDKQEHEAEIDTIKKTIEETEAEKQSLEAEKNVILTDRNNIYREVTECKKKLTENNQKLSLLEGNITALKGSVASYEMQKTVYIRSKDQYENYQMAVKRIMQHTKQDRVLDSKILGVVAELIKVPADYEIAIEVSLGGALQNIVTANTDDVKYCIEVLKRNKMGSITFLPINSLRARLLTAEQSNALKEKGVLGLACDLIEYDKAYDSVFKNLLGSTIVCDTYDNANLISKKYNRSIRIVTLEGEIFNPQGSITGGSSRKHDAVSILGREREFENICKNYDNATAQLKKATENHETLSSDVAKLNFLISNLNQQLIDKEVSLNTATSKVDLISDTLDKYIDDLKAKRENYDNLCDKLTIVETKLMGAGKLKTDISSQKSDYEDRKAKSKEKIDKMMEDRTILSNNLAVLKGNLSEIANKLTILENDLNHQKEQKGEADRDSIEAKNNLDKVRRLINDTENQINNAVLSEADKAKVDEIDGKITELTKQKNLLTESNKSILIEKDHNNQSLQASIAKKIKEEGNIEKLNVQFESLTNRIKEEYELEYETALPFKMEEYNDSESLQRLSQIKRAITNLGEISPSSILEFEELNQRYTTMNTEKLDLEKAQSDLLAIVRDLSREMQDIFDAEFSKIAKNFEITFKEIFGGGSGKLMLDPNAEDPLTAGVEIVAMLPGKKTKNLSALSGGEMALTAIAILFSILKTKPMPFCLLDEIEAALDDANVALFAKYLKKFVGNTQFIVITHRKPTMEQADRLFGVTMEERGVSKVVSVELAEAMKNVSED